MRFDLFVGIPRHENVCIGGKALSTAFGGATLQVGNLLDAQAELRLPLLFRYLNIFAVEDLIDGVSAVVKVLAR